VREENLRRSLNTRNAISWGEQAEDLLKSEEESLLAKRAVIAGCVESEETVEVLAKGTEARLVEPAKIILFEKPGERAAVNI